MRRALFVMVLVASLVVPTAAAAGAGVAPQAGSTGKVSWSVTSIPVPSGAVATYFTGVSCASGTACMVVGYYQTSSATLPLAAQWDGSAWKSETPPGESDTSFSSLSSVSCASSTSCTAIGSFADSSHFAAPFADYWNGSTWSLAGANLRQLKMAKATVSSLTETADARSITGRFGLGYKTLTTLKPAVSASTCTPEKTGYTEELEFSDTVGGSPTPECYVVSSVATTFASKSGSIEVASDSPALLEIMLLYAGGGTGLPTVTLTEVNSGIGY
ncbi:MAG: hypothetical protein ACLPYW_14150, partial [Acidimicrobiales bacterium]